MISTLTARWLSAALLAGTVSVAAAEPNAQAPLQFNRDIRPILSDNCFACHGPDEKTRKGKLRLDTEEGLFSKRDGYGIVIPGKRNESELFRRIMTSDEDDHMPPVKTGKALTSQQIELIGRWIDAGAPWQGHWAFIRPERPNRPVVKNSAWPRNEIDYFILQKLESLELEPSLEATREQLIRRLSYDLTGLPPAIDDIEAFLRDESPDAYDRLVERLLSSPQYGERMAVHWLDLARYADTHGYHLDSGRDMWKWREWVIDAFNNNQPFDKFTREQVAGDLLPDATIQQKLATGFNRNSMINFEGGAIPEEYLTQYIIDRVTTTSTVFLGLTVGCAQCHDHKFDPVSQKEFYRLYAYFNAVPENGLDGRNGNAAPLIYLPNPNQKAALEEFRRGIADAEKKLADALPAIDAAQPAWEQEMAIRLAASPNSEADKQTDDRSKSGSATSPEKLPGPELAAAILLQTDERTTAQKSAIQKFYRENGSNLYKIHNAELARRRKAFADFQKSIPTSMVMEQMEKPRDTFVLIRGQYNQHGEKVTPGVPESFHPLPDNAPPNRLGLAQWLMDPNNPLTARVTVNRFWALVMGNGLVRTANDFGTQSEWPSHPDLLDWLATEFVESGWNVKHLIRLFVTSATYRQSSVVSQELAERDPENRLYARGPRFRLSAEAIRDTALAVSGLLAKNIGGPSVSPYQPPGLWEELSMRKDSGNWSAQKYVQDHGDKLYRRSMYTFWKRTSPPPSLQAFDAPNRETCTVQRDRTTTPLQALVLMNDPTYVEAARFLAERIMTEGGSSVADRITYAFRLTLSRRPNAAELTILNSFFEQELRRFTDSKQEAQNLLSVGEGKRNESLDPIQHAAWTSVATTILNLDETITKS